MWIKDISKTKLNIIRRARNKVLRNATIIGLTFTALFTLSYGWAGVATKGIFFKNRDQIFKELPMQILLGFGIGIMYYYAHINKIQAVTLVCPRCGKVKEDDGILPCECGGHFEDIRTMKWVEDKTDTQ